MMQPCDTAGWTKRLPLAASHLFGVAALVCSTVSFAADTVVPAPEGMKTGISAQIRSLVRPSEDCAAHPVFAGTTACAEAAKVYAARDFAPLWVRSSEGPARLAALADELDRDRDHGLPPHDGAILGLRRAALDLDSAAQLSSEKLASMDVAATLFFLRTARERARGRLEPASADPQWFIKRPAYDAVAVLQAALAAVSPAAVLATQWPDSLRYQSLVREFEALKPLATEPFDRVPQGPTFKKGERNNRVVWLRARLGIAAAPGAASLFDEALEDAVKVFQQRHGLNADGVVGKYTLAALNVSPAERRAQLAVNMERLRWLGGHPRGRYIFVDVAEARLRLFEDDALVLEMRTAVGTDENQTPSFSGRMTYLVFRPYWNIPESIAGEEVVPKVLRDPEYLAQQNIEILPGWNSELPPIDPETIVWEDLDPEHLPFRLRQLPGVRNPLGNVKFMFPNRFNIYLHDTSNRGIFARDGRNLSHGCVRIQKPVSLATYLLRRESDWDVRRIEEAMSAEETAEIGLPEPIGVYLVYRTAFADSEGRVVYRRDFYERDLPVLQGLGLAKAPTPEVEAAQASALAN